MDRLPRTRISFAPGAPNITLVGVDPLTPETFNPLTATEETEKAQAATNQQRYEAGIEQLVEKSLMYEGGQG